MGLEPTTLAGLHLALTRGRGVIKDLGFRAYWQKPTIVKLANQKLIIKASDFQAIKKKKKELSSKFQTFDKKEYLFLQSEPT